MNDCRLIWEDGTCFEYAHDPLVMREQVARVFPDELAGFDRYSALNDKVGRSLLSRFQTVYGRTARCFTNERLREALSVSELLAGRNPFTKRASRCAFFTLHFTTRKRYTDVPYRTVLFGSSYRALVDEIFTGRELPTDMLIDLYHPTAHSSDLVPSDADVFTARVPVPSLDQVEVDWEQARAIVADQIVNVLATRCLPGLRSVLAKQKALTPLKLQTPVEYSIDALRVIVDGELIP